MGALTLTVMEPAVLVGTTAAFATVWPALKFRIETGGTAPPVGQETRKPGPVVPTTVKLTETAAMEVGRPQIPGRA